MVLVFHLRQKLIGGVDPFLGDNIPGAEVTTVFPPLDASGVVSNVPHVENQLLNSITI